MDSDFLHRTTDEMPLPCMRGESRSFSTSTPLLSGPETGKFLPGFSVSIVSTACDDSGLGCSLRDVTVSSPLDAGQSTTTVTAFTPKTNRYIPHLFGRNSRLSISPVTSKNKSRRKIEASLDVVDESHSQTSELFSNGNISSEIVEHSVDFEKIKNKSFVRKLDLDLDISNNDQKSSSSDNNRIPQANEVKRIPNLDEQFENIMNKFTPPVPDRLIGRKMGLENVDIISEIHERSMLCLSVIITYLEPQDLCRMCMVSKDWKTAVLSDRRAKQCRRRFLRYHKDRKKEMGKENEGYKRVVSPVNRDSMAPLQDRPVTQTATDPPPDTLPDRDKTDRERFIEVAATLKSDERLQKCPKCRKPAKVLPVQDRGQCTNLDCAYDFCTKCLYKFHYSKDCVPIVTKKTKTDSIGTKKSKANLKRL